MTNRKSVKRALVASIMAIMLCAVMLVGTTFAWFTDTASSAVNKIQSGNLDVVLEYSTDCATWKKVTDTTKLFEESKLWEPGRTEIVYLRVKNAGTLALKYTLGIYNLYESPGKNVEGHKYRLGDYVKLGAVETAAVYSNREEAVAAVSDTAKTLENIRENGVVAATLEPNDTKTYAMVLYMPTEVGNEANPKNSDPYWAAKVSFGISADASQAVSEFDSYGNDYDEKAPSRITTTSSSTEKLEVNENIQASGRYGVVKASSFGSSHAEYTINADLYAVYTKDGDGKGAAMAVYAIYNSKVIINGGDFRQVDVPADDTVCDLIYADDNAVIEINGGTFKAVDPTRTLNCKDGSSAKIIVNGGSFYQYDPSNHTLGAGEVVIGEGHTVEKVGDWYIVK